MGLLDFFKSKDSRKTQEEVTFPMTIGAACKGTCIAMSQIPDEVFSAGVLGTCCGIEPEEGKVYAPISGTIIQVADTLHAIGMEASGMELLIHVGIDTVELKGRGFHTVVKEGQYVKKGDLLLTMDLEMIRSEGYPAAVITAVTNSDDFSAVESIASGFLHSGEGMLIVNP